MVLPAAVMVIILGGWLHAKRRAPKQPGRRRGARVLAVGKNMEGQRGPLRRHHQRPVQRVYDQTSDGAVDSATDSFNPMGGFGPLSGMMLGEVTPGGTGSGLYTLLIYAIIAVFIAD